MTSVNEDIPCSWIGRVTTVDMSILPISSYGFNAVAVKIQANFTETLTNSRVDK